MITPALTEALQGMDLKPVDGATVALAHRYAALADSDPEMVPRVGPQLLQVLVELGMTPRARAGVVRGGESGDNRARTKLDELRERRTAREHDA